MVMSNPKNPLNMPSDPFAGDAFVFPETECTEERNLFFRRMNDIQSFLYVAKYSFDTCKENLEKNIVPKLPSKAKTPIKLEMSGKSVIMPAARLIEMTTNGINLVTRQALVMFYGSFETYLFQLFEKSFPLVGVTGDILDASLSILMRKTWDGKFCKMDKIFCIDYKATDLIAQFNDFVMDFEGQIYKNPLNFLDKLAQVRHRIVHASSILENNKLIFIDMKIFHDFFAFFFLLTNYVDSLFSKKFGYVRQKLNPALA